MTRPLYDIWQETGSQPVNLLLPWRAQLYGYVGYFPSRAAAEQIMKAVQKTREKLGLK